MDAIENRIEIPAALFYFYKEGKEKKVPWGIAAAILGGCGTLLLCEDSGALSELKVFPGILQRPAEGLTPILCLKATEKYLLMEVTPPDLWQHELTAVLTCMVEQAVQMNSQAKPHIL
jgi:hypothetical protein